MTTTRTTGTTTDDARTRLANERIAALLTEAHATELALVNTLGAHIAMTPAGEYRIALHAHLRETREHAERIERHLASRDGEPGILQVGYGLAVGALGQAFSVGKFPIDLLRGVNGEEKLLANLRDECASEAAEIAMYLALEQFATEIGDTETATLAASIRADEETMLDRLFELIPRLTADAVAAEVDGHSQFNVLRIGAFDGVRYAAATAARTVSRSTGRAARRVKPSSNVSTPSDRPEVGKPRAKTSRTSKPTTRKPAAKKSPARKTSARKATTAKR
jgi:ferritin-like metal-binding protein YciE